MRTAARQVHRFLVEQRFYPVALFVLASCLLFLGRWLGSGGRTFAFMIWNLILACIPYGLSFVAAAIDRGAWRWRGLAVAAAAVPWLAFLPNAPYLVTDLLHLRTITGVPVWYDAAMFACFAWAGCLLGVASLDSMRRLLAARVGGALSHAAALVVMGLCALGIYLGRVVRLNSWDLVLRPRHVLSNLWFAVHSREAVLFTMLFSGFLLLCYLTIAALDLRDDPRASALRSGRSACRATGTTRGASRGQSSSNAGACSRRSGRRCSA